MPDIGPLAEFPLGVACAIYRRKHAKASLAVRRPNASGLCGFAPLSRYWNRLRENSLSKSRSLM